MSVQANPFKRSTIVIMFVIGFSAFVAMLYGLGSGSPFSGSKNGEAHGASNSLVGYMALAELLQKTGVEVQYSRTAAGFNDEGLLVLTPASYSEAAEIARIVRDRAYIGPTLIILPKWQVGRVPDPRLKKGWVQRFATLRPASGEAMLKDITDVHIEIAKPDGAKSGKRPIAPSAVGGFVKIPDAAASISGTSIRNIVPSPKGGALVAYLDDGGVYAQLDSLDESRITDEAEIDASLFPVVFAADADLFNNGGMADKQTARHALALVDAVSIGSNGAVTFDLSFNGLGHSENLLTLAFKPPFLSATICLVIAALAAAWMAFNRFGPPVREGRSIDFGKTALVNNSAGFIHRMRREHLVAGTYGDTIRGEAIHAIGLSPDMEREDQDRKLDMLGEVDGHSFTELLDKLKHARNPQETKRWAAALYHWKKEFIG